MFESKEEIIKVVSLLKDGRKTTKCMLFPELFQRPCMVYRLYCDSRLYYLKKTCVS